MKTATKRKTPENTGKNYRIKPKPGHYRVAQNLSDNGGNAYKAIKEAGYSETMAKTPARILQSRGFLQIAEELGLTNDLIANSLVADIQSKPGNRVQELALASKLKGLMIDRQESVNVTAIHVTFSEA